MLSDNAKRLICRSGFFLLCVIPTLLCLKSILFPRTQLEWSANFQQQFGVINQIGDVRVMSPQRTDFVAMQLGADRFQSRLQIDSASLQTLNDGRVLYIENAVGSVSAFWDSIARITETVAWSGKSDRPVKLHIETMTFVENDLPGAQRCVWNDLQIAVTQKGRILSASFVCDQHTKAYLDSSRVQLERRNQNVGQEWMLRGKGFQIPAWVLKHSVPVASAMNVSATLADAEANLTHRDGFWSGEFNGAIQSIELQQVIAERFGSFITGNAFLHIDRGVLNNNRLDVLEGRVHSQSGSIGADLLQACTRSFGMQLVEPFGIGSNGIEQNEQYSNLHLGFVLCQETIAVYTMKDGSILNDENGNAMLVAQHGQEHPVSSLVRLMSRDQIVPEAATLAKHLFIPAAPPDRGFEFERTAKQNNNGDGTRLK